MKKEKKETIVMTGNATPDLIPRAEITILNPKKKKGKPDTIKQLLQKLRAKYKTIDIKEPDKYTWQIRNLLGEISLMEEKRELLNKNKKSTNPNDKNFDWDDRYGDYWGW